MNRRRLVTGGILIAAIALLGWTYVQSLVPAVHPDHDHGLENIAGGGFLRVEAVEGGKRNLVGRPGRVLVLHWFALGSEMTKAELPLLVDYAKSVAGDDGIEVVMIAVGTPRRQVLEWAHDHGVPTKGLYVDPERKVARLIGVHRTPETLIYGPEGRLAHQARGPIQWSDPDTRRAIAASGHHEGDGHQH